MSRDIDDLRHPEWTGEPTMPDTPDLTALRDAAYTRLTTQDRFAATYLADCGLLYASGDLVPAAELCALREVAEAARVVIDTVETDGTDDEFAAMDTLYRSIIALDRYNALKGADNAE